MSHSQLHEYAYLIKISTRWMDNDIYAHINNVVYYSYFDTVVNHYLVENNVLDPVDGEVIGLVVETQCHYFSPIRFPDTVTAALNVSHIGNSSVRYEIGIFKNEEKTASAEGHFIHVYVDKKTRESVCIPANLREVLLKLTTKQHP